MSLFINEIVEENARLKEEIEKLKQENQHYLEEYEILGEEWSKLLDDKISYSHLLQKYKKVIDFLKKYLGIYLDEDWIIINEVMIIINDEEKKLFKEVLDNEFVY